MDFNSPHEELAAVTACIRQGAETERFVALARLVAIAQDVAPNNFALFRCLQLVQSGVIRSEELHLYIGSFLGIWGRVYSRLKALQKDTPAREWMYEGDEYTEARDLAGVLLDLLGYLRGEEATGALREACALLDPRLKAFAAISLARRGQTVDPDLIECVASNDETRIVFWNGLQQVGRTDLMPQNWSATEKLAASALVNWAGHPNELGTPPEEIELKVKFLVDLEGEQLEVFLFRFREYPKPWAPSEGWMAGIAGPFVNGESLGSPWSSFELWDSKSPKEHFQHLLSHACWCELDDQDADSAPADSQGPE